MNEESDPLIHLALMCSEVTGVAVTAALLAEIIVSMRVPQRYRGHLHLMFTRLTMVELEAVATSIARHYGLLPEVVQSRQQVVSGMVGVAPGLAPSPNGGPDPHASGPRKGKRVIPDKE